MIRNSFPFIAIALLFCLSSGLNLAFAKEPLRIVIDPGHGGSDSGAVRGSLKESELALNVSQLLKNRLEQNPDFQVQMTRTEDVNLSLQQRVSSAEKSKSDVLISLHANASSDSRARGFEIYFQNHLPPDEDMMFLANVENQIMKTTEKTQAEDQSKKSDVAAIVDDLKRSYRMQASHLLTKQISANWMTAGSSPIRQAPFYVLAKSTMPSVLIELGFISNPRESEKLSRPEYQKEITERIYKGLLRYKELIDKGQGPSLN